MVGVSYWKAVGDVYMPQRMFISFHMDLTMLKFYFEFYGALWDFDE